MRSTMTTFLNKAYTGVHQHTRHLLPQWQQRANGVTYTGRLGDRFNDAQPAGNKRYEKGLIDAVRHCVQEDDDVTVVGGGHGITALASQQQGGNLTVYEPGQRMATTLCRRLSCTVIYEGFYEDRNVYGDGTTTLKGEDLEPCDVLVLDCEGVEHLIIDDLQFLPRHVVVETHGFLGSDKDMVSYVLEKHGFDVDVVVCQDRNGGVYVLRGYHG